MNQSRPRWPRSPPRLSCSPRSPVSTTLRTGHPRRDRPQHGRLSHRRPSRRGRGCAPDNVTRRVNTARARPARDPSGNAQPWSSPPAQPHKAKAPTCPNATGRSRAAAVTPRPSSPSATRSCSPPTPTPGPTTFSRLSAQRLTGQAVRRLRDLGDQVTIAPRTDAAWASVPASRLAFSEQQQFAAQRRSGSPARNVWPASHGGQARTPKSAAGAAQVRGRPPGTPRAAPSVLSTR